MAAHGVAVQGTINGIATFLEARRSIRLRIVARGNVFGYYVGEPCRILKIEGVRNSGKKRRA